MKLSTFIISFLFASMVIVGFVAFYAKIATTYTVTYSDNISQLDQFNNISDMTTDIKDSVATKPASTGGFAIIGDFLGAGYDIVITTFRSFSIFNDMLNAGFNNIPVGDEAGTLNRFKVIIGLIVFVIIIFIVIAILLNRQNL